MRLIAGQLCVALSMLLAGCGGRAVAPEPANPTPPAPEPGAAVEPETESGFASLQLPVPTELLASREARAMPPTYRLLGAQLDPVIPPYRVGVRGTIADLSPKSSSNDLNPLAYCAYRFNLAGHSGPAELHFEWVNQRLPDDLYVAVPDYNRDRWRWLACPGRQQLTLSVPRLAAGLHQPSQDLLLIVACTTRYGLLGRIRIGVPSPSNIQITGVSVSTLLPQQKRRIYATYTGGVPAAWRWEDGPVIGPRHGKSALLHTVSGSGAIPMRVVAVDAAGGEARYDFMLNSPNMAQLPPYASGVSRKAARAGEYVGFTAGLESRYDFLNDQLAWDFGGGGTPSAFVGPLGLITAGEPGVYPASLTISGPRGSHRYDYFFTVTALDEPLAPYFLDPREAAHLAPVMAGAPATFWFDHRGDAAQWQWTFGEQASPPASTASEPQVTFSAPGEFACTAYVENSSGHDTQQFTATVLDPMPPYISGIQRELQYPGEQAGYGINGLWFDSVHWDFGGAFEPDTSSELDPLTTAAEPGWYLGKLTATNAHGATEYFFGIEVPPIAPPEFIALGWGISKHPPPAELRIPANRTGLWLEVRVTSGPVGEIVWDFGAACDPPQVLTPLAARDTETSCRVDTLAPGSYQCSVTARNSAGETVLPFTLVLY